MRKILFLLTCLLLSPVGSAKMLPAFVQLKVFDKTFNCNALPKIQREDITKYTCSLPPGDPDLASISVQNFWISKNNIFKPKDFLEELLRDVLEGNGSVFTCPKPNPNIAVGSGIVDKAQVLLRVTPSSLILLENMNPKNNWVDTEHLSYLCQ